MRFCRRYTVFSSVRQGTDVQSPIGRSIVDRPSFPLHPATDTSTIHVTVPASAYRGRYPTPWLLGQSFPAWACGLAAYSPSHRLRESTTRGYPVPILRFVLPVGPHYLPGRHVDAWTSTMGPARPDVRALAGQTRYLAWVCLLSRQFRHAFVS
jgi:hypothetical protein